MRGKVPDRGVNRFQIGITPAYAGKSFSNVTGFFKEQDHPRLCGEKPYFYDAVTQRVGSPPPMRGKGLAEATNETIKGITPAYAGKSRTCWKKSRGTWDHPRLCGEKIRLMYEGLAPIGSPPPMRGKVWDQF